MKKMHDTYTNKPNYDNPTHNSSEIFDFMCFMGKITIN